MDFKPIVQDITHPFAIKTSIKTTGRGTALIMFPDPVPAFFQDVMHGKIAKELADTTGRDTISMEVDAKFIGMTQLHGLAPDVKHMADIVAIHGLNGHPYGSWLSKSDSPKMWLKDFLPEDAPNCRIFIYGYESNIFSEPTHPRFDLAEQADRLIQALDGIRGTDKLKKKPIIFIAHSFGGLVLAKALVKACTGPSKKPLYSAAVGLFLLACPLRGFHVQDILDAMEADQQETEQDCITDNKAKALVQRLGEGNFRNELDSLPDILKGKRVYTFVEQRQTRMVVKGKVILRRDGELVMAAGPHTVILGLGSDMEEVISADKDHSSIVKFDLRSDETYQNIKRRIQDLVMPDSAPRRPFKFALGRFAR
ncbi:hypothetical protein B0T24DRAFT_393081 [Lasiosphaeria ovina]|uniref:AB hydrolase-1 domain-containing protein n=1 Tax=Lasiosphaeria ovina TaxID=92902 RepID=A0AAE0JWF6_9PEZI|nr:hypothetical protein B0T24DRAFT_393081 [Lasiosphaeria ovina]